MRKAKRWMAILTLSVLLMATGPGISETAWQVEDPILPVFTLRGEDRDALAEKVIASLRLKAAYETPIAEMNDAQKAQLAEETGFYHSLPGADDLPWQQAFDVALDAVQQAYSLDDAYMENFYAMFSFNGAHPDAPEWLIHFYPIDHQNFSDFGMYGAYIHARTGEVTHLFSPADAAG